MYFSLLLSSYARFLAKLTPDVDSLDLFLQGLAYLCLTLAWAQTGQRSLNCHQGGQCNECHQVRPFPQTWPGLFSMSREMSSRNSVTRCGTTPPPPQGPHPRWRSWFPSSALCGGHYYIRTWPTTFGTLNLVAKVCSLFSWCLRLSVVEKPFPQFLHAIGACVSTIFILQYACCVYFWIC